MHPLKLLEFSAPIIQMEDAVLYSPACNKALAAFQENVRLTQGLIAIPGWSAMIKMQWDMCINNAAIEISGPNGLLDSKNWTESQVIHWRLRRHELMKKEVEEHSPLVRDHLAATTSELDDLAMSCGPFVHGMMVGLLKSVCVQAWTALEVLIEDLHCWAIEDHPKCFSIEIRDKTKRTREFGEKRFHFRNREAFRCAYNSAFSYDSRITAAIEHKSIDALVAVRNLIVHKGGVVDGKFMKDELPKAPTLNNLWVLEADKAIEFDGHTIHTLIGAAVGQGYELIRAVNNWLQEKHFATL